MKLGPYLLGPEDREGQYGIYTGDALALSDSIPDNSIDLIITDPPYDLKSLYLYGSIAHIAPRVLKKGHSMFAYGGMVAPEVMNLLVGGGLHLHFVHVLLHVGGYPRWWTKKLMVGYKPVYELTNGAPADRKWMSTVHVDERDKRYHEWGQGIGFPVKIIEMFTNPKDVVLDFFCGGGQVPEACKVTGRRWLAFELDEEVAEGARKRLRDVVQEPLLIPQPDQLELFD